VSCCRLLCASLSGLSHAPVPQLLRGSPKTRAHCAVGAHRGLGAGCSVCVNIFLSLGKPPTPAPRSSKLCVPGARQGPPACLPGHDSWQEGGGARAGCGAGGRQALGEESVALEAMGVAS
jgi:hypothetical protein